MSTGLTFNELNSMNRLRVREWHSPETIPWSGADWSNAMQGEAGEFGNVVKKLRRHETGLATKRDLTVPLLLDKLANEAADTVTYLDLAMNYYGLNLGSATVRKFNTVSERVGYPYFLDAHNWVGNARMRAYILNHAWHLGNLECEGCTYCA